MSTRKESQTPKDLAMTIDGERIEPIDSALLEHPGPCPIPDAFQTEDELGLPCWVVPSVESFDREYDRLAAWLNDKYSTGEWVMLYGSKWIDKKPKGTEAVTVPEDVREKARKLVGRAMRGLTWVVKDVTLGPICGPTVANGRALAIDLAEAADLLAPYADPVPPKPAESMSLDDLHVAMHERCVEYETRRLLMEGSKPKGQKKNWGCDRCGTWLVYEDPYKTKLCPECESYVDGVPAEPTDSGWRERVRDAIVGPRCYGPYPCREVMVAALVADGWMQWEAESRVRIWGGHVLGMQRGLAALNDYRVGGAAWSFERGKCGDYANIGKPLSEQGEL